MTISDLVARLSRLQKEIGGDAQIKLGKRYNKTSDCFDFFDIDSSGDCVVLVPSDKWEVKHKKRKLKLNGFYGEQEDED